MLHIGEVLYCTKLLPRSLLLPLLLLCSSLPLEARAPRYLLEPFGSPFPGRRGRVQRRRVAQATPQFRDQDINLLPTTATTAFSTTSNATTTATATATTTTHTRSGATTAAPQFKKQNMALLEYIRSGTTTTITAITSPHTRSGTTTATTTTATPSTTMDSSLSLPSRPSYLGFLSSPLDWVTSIVNQQNTGDKDVKVDIKNTSDPSGITVETTSRMPGGSLGELLGGPGGSLEGLLASPLDWVNSVVDSFLPAVRHSQMPPHIII